MFKCQQMKSVNLNKMLSNFGPGIRLQSGSNPFFFSIFKPLKTKTLTLAMASLYDPDNRRPTCPSCSKPTRVCFCNRFKTPVLENSIAVTLLQHRLEMKHPLNSAKIATLGLKNVNLAYVSDVISETHFELHFLEPNHDLGHQDLIENHKKIQSLHPADISFKVEKRGVKNQDFDKLLGDQELINGLRNGFVVTKIHKGVDGNNIQEFKLVVPPGSILLFPSESSLGVEEFKDVGFDVKNLIVLDGTWAKATRMYKENPWLRLLPHLKLSIDKLSLFAEVRRQPKARCLSSIESIVYALKAIGEDDHEGLDCLLDVFESMVVDQRRCMNERLQFESGIKSI